MLVKLITLFNEMRKQVDQAVIDEQIPTDPVPKDHLFKLFEQIAVELTWLYINLPCLDKEYANEVL